MKEELKKLDKTVVHTNSKFFGMSLAGYLGITEREAEDVFEAQVILNEIHGR